MSAPARREQRSRGLVRPALVAFAIAISAAFTYLAVRDVHVGRVWAALRETHYVWLVPALALMTLVFFVRALRWQVLFRPESRPGFRATARSLFIGYFFNNVLPARAGELARVAALNRLARVRVTEAAATIVVERIFDALSLLVLLFAMTPWLPHVAWLRAAGFFAVALAVAVGVVILVLWRYGERPIRFVLRPFGRLPFLPQAAVHDAPSAFLNGLGGFLSFRQGLLAFTLTTASWGLLGVAFWFVMIAFSFDVSPLAGVLVVIAIGLAMILPSSPAAVGVFEGATVVALTAYGIGDSEALSYALVLHAVNFFPFILVAIPMFGGRAVPGRRPAGAGIAGASREVAR